MSAETATVAEQAGDLPVELTPTAAGLVEQMTDELGLWETQVDASLFLVGLAVARGKTPVPAEDREPADVTVGSLAETEAGDLEHLAILDVLDEDAGELADTIADDLPGWAEAGAGLLGPRLEGVDAVEATAEILEIAREIS